MQQSPETPGPQRVSVTNPPLARRDSVILNDEGRQSTSSRLRNATPRLRLQGKDAQMLQKGLHADKDQHDAPHRGCRFVIASAEAIPQHHAAQG